jgi:hypothetical protein
MQAESNSKPRVGVEDQRQRELRHLVAVYSIRVRELSEAAAALGGHVAAGSGYQGTVMEIKRLSALCEEAGRDLLDVIEGEDDGQ